MMKTIVPKVDVNHINDMLTNIGPWLMDNGIKLVIGIVVLVVGFKIIDKLIKQFVTILAKQNADETITKFSKSLLKVLVKIILLMLILEYWGISLSGVAAIMASAGIAVGLALQGSLANFAGGFIILFLRPFKVGDFIETGSYMGKVEVIGLFYTTLVTTDNKQVLIPNGTLANGSLINYNTKDTRRVDLTFGVGYESDILEVKKVLTNIIKEHKLILHHPEPFIALSEHGPSSINFVIRVWVQTSDYWTVHFDLLEKAKLKFDEKNIRIPYPQMEINFKKINP